MPRIQIRDLPNDQEITKEEMKRIHGGVYTSVCMLPGSGGYQYLSQIWVVVMMRAAVYHILEAQTQSGGENSQSNGDEAGAGSGNIISPGSNTNPFGSLK